jgi:hypothetical protein
MKTDEPREFLGRCKIDGHRVSAAAIAAQKVGLKIEGFSRTGDQDGRMMKAADLQNNGVANSAAGAGDERATERSTF